MPQENNNETEDKQDEVIDETSSTVESLNTDEQVNVDTDTEGKHIPYDRFKQKVDEANALKKKLADIEKQRKADEQKQLEEQNDYKTLYEQAQEQIEANKADALKAAKTAKLIQAGYDEEQVEVLRSTIDGETDEEIAKAIEGITSVIPPKKTYIDPTPMGGGDGKPKPKDEEEVGRSAISKVLHKIKL